MPVTQVDDHTVRFGAQDRTFEQRVKSVFQVGDSVVVHLKTGDFATGDTSVGRNVVGFDMQGNQTWIVEDHKLKIGPKDSLVPQSFLSVFVDEEDGLLRGVTPSVVYEIDARTGKLTNPAWNR